MKIKGDYGYENTQNCENEADAPSEPQAPQLQDGATDVQPPMDNARMPAFDIDAQLEQLREEVYEALLTVYDVTFDGKIFKALDVVMRTVRPILEKLVRGRDGTEKSKRPCGCGGTGKFFGEDEDVFTYCDCKVGITMNIRQLQSDLEEAWNREFDQKGRAERAEAERDAMKECVDFARHLSDNWLIKGADAARLRNLLAKLDEAQKGGDE